MKQRWKAEEVGHRRDARPPSPGCKRSPPDQQAEREADDATAAQLVRDPEGLADRLAEQEAGSPRSGTGLAAQGRGQRDDIAGSSASRTGSRSRASSKARRPSSSRSRTGCTSA